MAFVRFRICPIFTVSCVTGENIDLLKKFLNILPPRLSLKDQEAYSSLPVEYRVRFLFSHIEFNSHSNNKIDVHLIFRSMKYIEIMLLALQLSVEL